MSPDFDPPKYLRRNGRDVFFVLNGLDLRQISFQNLSLVECHAPQADAAVVHGEAVALRSNQDVGAELVHLPLDIAGHGAGQGHQGDDGGDSHHQADGQERHLRLAALKVIDGNGMQFHQKYLAPPLRSLALIEIVPPFN